MKQPTALVNPDGEIERLWEHDAPEVGPILYPRVPVDYRYVVLPALFDINSPPTGSCVAMMGGDGTPYWQERGDLESIKREQTAAINAAHTLANRTSFMFQGKEIQADEHSMTQIQITNGGILTRGGLRPGWLGAWKALDNTYVAIPDLATWHAFYESIEATGTANFIKAQTLKQAITAAQTIAEVTAITWQPPQATS